MNYKDTLKLPHTTFPMKANLSVLEPKMTAFWQEIDIYQELLRRRSEDKKFILHEGPPYANGKIHIGHALNKILKDIVIKYKVLKGYNCPSVVGWDCHGLPVEHQLFKELKLTKHDVNAVEFRKKARDYALKFVDLQREDFKKLGAFSDWQNPYLTLDAGYESRVMELLGLLVEEGYVYRGRRPVNWCASCETALAEAEVEYADKQSESIYVFFKIEDSKNVKGLKSIDEAYLLVWTTTPWTLISNVAVALHPELEYVLVEIDGRHVLFAGELLAKFQEKFNVRLEPKLKFKGNQLEGISLKHPFINRESPVVLAEFISKEEGSGCVHIAPGHGEEDFSLTKKYNLDIIMPVNDKGVFEEPAEFKGKNIKDAGDLVLDKLREKGALARHEKITHSYPHCWRCKKPIIFRATFQWFLNVNHKKLRERMLNETVSVKWVPPSGQERMKGMLETKPDWCLSRQRIWGVPIPALKCVSCGEVILDKEVIAKVVKTFKEKGSDSWFIGDAAEFIPEKFKCPACGKGSFSKEFDILDVWFESGASFFSVVENNPQLSFPSDLYLEGSDQHRGWFQTSLTLSMAKEKRTPFK
ncbi:MAG: isoleucine--tRNA ligase, partial [Candidatus Omnitrophica bacterium]|nr:isoleucine--tRNA ligase [Candidatus Omnitrophota bacterium]